MPYKFHPLHLLPGVGMVVLFIAGQMLMTGSMEQQDLTALRRPPEAAPPQNPRWWKIQPKKALKNTIRLQRHFHKRCPHLAAL